MSRIFESPFLDSELFVVEPDHGADRRTDALIAGSPFLDAFSTDDVIAASDSDDEALPGWRESSNEFVEEHAEPDDESYDRERDADGEMLFEQFAPVVSASDLRTRIDDFLAKAEATYTLPGPSTVKVPPTFRYAKSGNIETLATKLSRTLGSKFERDNPGAIHFAVYGRPTLKQIVALTQALIDKGEFKKTKDANPSMTDVQAVRQMQRDFGVGIDCAGYVQLSFINAFMGKDDDSPAVRRSLGLNEKRGWERLSDLPLTHFQKFTDVTKAQTGDLLILEPKGGDWHTVIIVDRSNVDSIHSFLCDASWGRDLYGDDNAGVQRRELMHDTATGEWWDMKPGTTDEANRNDIGPYAGHRVQGVYRPRTSAAAKAKKPVPRATPELELEEAFETDEEAGPHPDCSTSGHGIHGDDDRRKVTNPLEVPCRWICHIWARRVDSDGKVTHTGGTGVLISPRHVLTVAHLLCDSVRKDGRVITYDADYVRVTPARNGDDRPFDTHVAKLPARIAKGWTARGMAAPYDYALLTLEKPIGNKEWERLGGRKLCYWGSHACGEGTSVRAAAPRALEGRTALTAGYPKDRGGGLVPHITSGQLSNVTDTSPLMNFSADACQGQSGSPVWVNVDGKHCLVGIMRSVGETTNTALRISEAMCIQLRKWMGKESDACSPGTPAPVHEYAEDETDDDESESPLDVELEEPDAYELDEPEGELIADFRDTVDEEAVTCRCRETPVSYEARELDPVLSDIAERIARRRAPLMELDTPKKFSRCFSTADIGHVRKVYEDNATAATSDSGDRCSCIVMLNVAMGALLKVKTKKSPARSSSDRDVDMATLPTESIEKSMQALVRAGKAKSPIVMNFQDSRGRTAGTLKPVKLKTSVKDRILKEASKKGCWFAFGLSVMDGYHSVLLLVDRTGTSSTIYWLDQFSTGIDDDVTATLDDRLTSMTQNFWQSVKDSKGIGSDTMVRIWALGVRK